MWCVAIFCDDGDIRIVCQKWLVESTKGNVRCWYPTAIDGNKLNRLLAENTGPDQEKWEMVAIEILKDNIGTLIDARKIAKKAEDEETSLSLTEPENMGRGRRKKKSSQRVLSPSSSDEENPPPLSTVSKRSRPQEEPPRSLLRIQSLKWPTSCIDKAGRLPFSDLNQISRPQGVASSTQKPPPSSSNAPKTTHKTGTPQPPSHFQNSNQVKGFAASTQKPTPSSSYAARTTDKTGTSQPPSQFQNSYKVQGFAASTQKPPPSSSNAPKTTHKTGTSQPPSHFQNSNQVKGFAASTQKPTPSSSHAATTTDKTGPVPITSRRKNYPKVQIPNASQSHIKMSKTSTHSSAAHYAPPRSTNFDPRVQVDKTSAGEIIQKLANFQEQLNRIEKITVQTASKVVVLSNVSGDVPTALIEIQSKLSDLLLVENHRLRDEILQYLPINDDTALNEFEAKLIDPKFRSAFIKFMATKGSTKNVSLCVKKLMKELLVDTFAINYCMTGHLGKKPFMDNRNLFESIAAATRSFHPSATDDDIKLYASQWLTKAKERINSKAKSHSSLENNQSEAENAVNEQNSEESIILQEDLSQNNSRLSPEYSAPNNLRHAPEDSSSNVAACDLGLPDFSQIWAGSYEDASASELVGEERYDGENERDERDREELDDAETYFERAERDREELDDAETYFERDERDREELDDEETYFGGGTDFVDMFR